MILTEQRPTTGHPFYGNQWVSAHPQGDPKGVPSGAIKHAVLIINGKRYRGRNHFQALSSYLAGNRYDDAAIEAVSKLKNQGFETESGHFLTREQAATYVSHDKRQLRSENLQLVARDGLLYTKDVIDSVQIGSFDKFISAIDAELVCRDLETIFASDSGLTAEQELHNHVRDHAQAIYQEAYDGVVSKSARQLHKREKEGEIAALFLLIFDSPRFRSDMGNALFEAGEEAHRYVENRLGSVEWGQPDERATEFSKTRLNVLENIPKETAKKLEASILRGVAAGESPLALARRFDEAVRDAKETIGERMAATESQVCYGVVQDATLLAAGFTHKRWISERDERVRESHVECDKQGAIPIEHKFINGGRFPGDPNLPVSEVVNCRCWLVGEKR